MSFTILKAGVYHDCVQHNMMVTYAASRTVHFIDFACEYDSPDGVQDWVAGVPAVPISYRYFARAIVYFKSCYHR